MLTDYLVTLGLDVLKDKIASKFDEKEIMGRLASYIEVQNKYNFRCTHEEELDLEGLFTYIRSDLIEDVRVRIYGEYSARQASRQNIIEKAVKYSQAKTRIAERRAIQITANAVDLLREFYRAKVNKELFFVAAQIEDTIIENVEEIVQCNTETLKKVIDDASTRVNDAISAQSMISLERNIMLARAGSFDQVERNIDDWLKGLSASHSLQPDYGFGLRSRNGKLEFFSQPQNETAMKKYPPRMVCTANVFMDGKPIKCIDQETVDYANRHQLPIVVEILEAQQFLGQELDPIQHEAEAYVGEIITLAPKPFPPAFPCNISLDDEVIFDYICLRTEEILENGSRIFSNREQDNCEFYFAVTDEKETGKVNISITINDQHNSSMLKFLRFISGLSSGKNLAIKVLNTGKVFLKGRFWGVNFWGDEERLRDTIAFYEHIVGLERYYKKDIQLPDEVTIGQNKLVLYLSSLIRGNESKGTWDKLEFFLTGNEGLQNAVRTLTEEPINLDCVTKFSTVLFGEKFEYKVVRNYKNAVVCELQRLLRKMDDLEEGETVKICFMPYAGQKGDFVDRLYNRDDDYDEYGDVNDENQFRLYYNVES